MAYRHLAELRADWRRSRGEIERRLEEFRRLRTASDERMVAELAFSLFAIPTRARRAPGGLPPPTGCSPQSLRAPWVARARHRRIRIKRGEPLPAEHRERGGPRD